MFELPPPTQGVAVLEGLALLDGLPPDLANQVKCVALALEDAREHVRDGADVSRLLEPGFLERRRAERPLAAGEPTGGTVYLCAVDGDRMAVSFIQSLFGRFGAGLVAPGTGVVFRTAAPASSSREASSQGPVPTTRSSPACSCARARSSARSG